MKWKNKQKFISLLSVELEKIGCNIVTASEDADRLIITTAIDLQRQNNIVRIIGEDADLLVLLTQLAPTNNNIYYLSLIHI